MYSVCSLNFNKHQMKKTISLTIVALLVNASVYARTTIAAMTTEADAVTLELVWSGIGKIFANGILLNNGGSLETNTIAPNSEGKVILTATEDALLTHLSCRSNRLTALDVSNCTALTMLDCYDNQLTALDVSNNTALMWLYCHWNQLTTLNLSNNPKLTHLYCGSNQLTALDVSGNTALMYLHYDENQLTTLDVSSCTAL